MKSTKEIIIDEAVKLFASLGFDASSMRKIADKVGVTEPAIYRHFKNKQALGREIFQTNYALMAKKIREARETSKAPEEVLRQSVTVFCDYFDNNPDLFKYLLLTQHQFVSEKMDDDKNVAYEFSKIVASYLASKGKSEVNIALATAITMGSILQPSVFVAYGNISGNLADHATTLSRCCIGALDQFQ